MYCCQNNLEFLLNRKKVSIYLSQFSDICKFEASANSLSAELIDSFKLFKFPNLNWTQPFDKMHGGYMELWLT